MNEPMFVDCRRCHGLMAEPDTPDELCRECHGDGEVMVRLHHEVTIWKDPQVQSIQVAPCGEPCGPEGCLLRGCPVCR